MRPKRSLPLLPALILTGTLLSSSTAGSQVVAPSVRIAHPVDDSSLVTLKGNTHPAANARNDRGRVSPDLPMTDLIMVLSRGPEQQAAFDKFVAAQYDPKSPRFHRWLSPEEVGADFGPSPADIATISNWLTRHGFSIAEVAPNRMSIRFGGAAAQVESAFHTEIHNLEVKGVAHIGNMTDPQIPSALAPVVVGVKSLHDFFPRPQHRLGSPVTRDPATGKWRRVVADPADPAETVGARPAAPRPQFNTVDANSNLLEDVSPYDFATIYNVLPLWQANTPIDGSGQTIAIAGTSNICLAQTDANCSDGKGGYNNDVAAFRSSFGLPAYKASNQPTAVSGNSHALAVCTDTSSSAICGINDLVENSLDVEWAGAVAPGAKIVLVASYPDGSKTDDPLYDSESYIVNHKTASIMNSSYGECELGIGTAGNVEYYNLWQTAYAEGIAVFVASGDAGSAMCDQGGDAIGNPYSAQYGLSVNGLASTPFNTAVGGTDFNWCSLTSTCTSAPYWNATNNLANGSSAIGYIPEVPWNDTCANPLAVGFLESWATSSAAGNVGGVTDTESGCNFIYNYYPTVDANAGVSLEYIVDTYGGGGGASGCVVNDGANVSSCSTTTTSTGAGNGSIPLFNDGWPKPGWQSGVSGIPTDGVRDLPDVSFFASDGFLSSSAYLICVSARAACTYSATSEPGGLEVGGTSVASPAMAGVMALINQKAGLPQGNPNAELYNLASQQTYASCSAEIGSTTNGCLFNDIDQGTIAVPCDYGGDEGGQPGSGIVSPNCAVNNSNDLIGILSGYDAVAGYDLATGLGSLNVANLVNAWPVSAGAGTATVTVSPDSLTLSSSSALSVPVTVAAATQGGATPTGTVMLSGGGYSSAVETLIAGTFSFDLPANSLTPGSDTLTVTYSGDATYGSTTGTATVAVAAPLATPTVTVHPSVTILSSNAALSVQATVEDPAGGSATPTGTVTLSGGGYTSPVETLAGGTYSFTVPANSLTAGSYALNVSYSGDTNYTPASGSSASITVSAALATATVTVTPAATTLSVANTLNVAAKVASASGSGPTPGGTVTLSGGGYTSSAQTLVAGVVTVTIPANSLSVGSDTLTVTYSGDSNYATNTGTASVTVSSAGSGTFTLSASTTTAVAPGTSATSTITATAANGYTGTATLSCALTSSSPSSVTDPPTCSLSPTTVDFSTNSTGNVTATVASTAATTGQFVPHDGRGKGWLGGGAVLALLVFLGIPARRRSWQAMLGAILLIAALGSLSGCGDFWQAPGGNSGSGTTAGTYTFTVTGTGTPAVTAVTTTFAVTVN